MADTGAHLTNSRYGDGVRQATERAEADVLTYPIGILRLGPHEVQTIASGVLTTTQSYVWAAAESSTSDQVDSIVADWAQDGDFLVIVADTGDTITIDDANIDLGAATRAVAPGGSITLRFDGTTWAEYQFLAAADNTT